MKRRVERKIVSVLFCDLVGFTRLSEAMDAEDVVAIQDAYFDAVEDTVGRYGGRLEKYIGDAAVAVFGVPVIRDDDAERAVRAGLALASAVDLLAGRLGLEERTLRLRVGVNTGEVVETEGSASRGPVTGDTVNVAARLQAAAPPGGVMLGESTALAVAHAFEIEVLDPLELKGKAAPVRASRAVAARPAPAREHAMGGLRAPMLGRDVELDVLEAAFARVRGGGSARFVVVAPPGAGKSRLVEEFSGTPDALVLHARLRPDMLAPFEPIAQLLLDALAGVTRPEEARAVLLRALARRSVGAARSEAVAEQALAALRPDAAEAATTVHDLSAGRDAQFGAWLEAFEALAGDRPSLWVVEDAHWAGRDLLAFLELVGDVPAAAGRLVLVTARPSILEVAPDWCIERLELAPLAAADAGALVRALVGDVLPAPLVERIAERSDGNPLFIEELLRTWASAGTLARRNERWVLVGDADVAVPPTVHAIYAGQLDDLPAAARAAARRGSVPGRRFPVAALARLDVEDADEAVEVLTRRALVAGPHPDLLTGASYTFRHALLRDAGYASLARAERALLHVRFAGWLEEVCGSRRSEAAELIGRHYARSLEEAPALAREVAPGVTQEEAARLSARWFDEAAEAALGVSAHETARSLLGRALAVTPHGTPEEAERRTRLGEISQSTLDMDAAAIELERGFALYGELFQVASTAEERRRARVGLARVAAALAHLRIEQIAFPEAVRVTDETLARIGADEDAETARLLLARGIAFLSATDEVEQPLADVVRARALALAAGDEELSLEALLAEARVRTQRGEDTTELWHKVERAALATRRWQVAVAALRAQAARFVDDDPRRALHHLEGADELAATRGLTEEQGWNLYTRTEAELGCGAWDDAVEHGLQAVELGERHAYQRVVVRSWFALTVVAAARGDVGLLERAHAWFAGRSFPQPPAPWARLMLTAVDRRFRAYGLSPATGVAEDIPAVLDALAEPVGAPAMCAAAEELLEAWLAEGADDAVADALGRIRLANRAPTASRLASGIERLLSARVAIAHGRPTEAAEAAREAVEMLAAIPAPWWQSKALRLIGLLDEPEVRGDAEAEAARIEQSLGVRKAALR